jgi:hypothetical protein
MFMDLMDLEVVVALEVWESIPMAQHQEMPTLEVMEVVEEVTIRHS